MSDFENFLKEYIEAIKKEDAEFMKRVYADWLESSGVVPEDKLDFFYKAVFQDLKDYVTGKLEGTESYDGFDVAHFTFPDGSFTDLVFEKKGDSWMYFNARSNFRQFKNVYAINYDVKGEGTLRILFNGRRSPVVTDMKGTRQGMISLINAALKVGENEVVLQSLDGSPLEVSLQISSAKEGEVLNSAQGNDLSWEGTVKEPVTLKFSAE